MKKPLAVGFVIALSMTSLAARGEDTRQRVQLPEMMQAHMLGNMRDHLQALNEIQAALSQKQFDKAADIAEHRIGMSSLAAHGAARMAPFMPEKMQKIGMEMHHAASRFALVAVEGDLGNALGALSEVTRQCVACHADFRIH